MNAATEYFHHACNLARALEAKSSTQWLAAFRQRHIQALQSARFPTRTTEHFKYINLAALTKQPVYSVDRNADTNTAIAIPEPAAHPDAERVVLVNGQYSAALSSIRTHQVTRFQDADARQRALILEQLQRKPSSPNVFRLVNQSLLHDGMLIEFSDTTPAKPLHIIYARNDEAPEQPIVSTLIAKVNRHAQTTLIEHFVPSAVSDRSPVYYPATHCVVDDNAHLHHYRLHLEEETAALVGEMDAWLHKGAQFHSFHMGLGGRLKRIDVNVHHQGEGAHAALNGIYLSTNQQQIDYHTAVEHCVPHCTTAEVFRGLAGGQSKAVFNGRIHIHPGAQKTVAELSNKNLLLSNKAQINTKPELEIYADDVQCAHGATVAQLDAASLFYLVSRGIPRPQAQLLLSQGFVNALLDGLAHDWVADYIRPQLTEFFQEHGAN